MSSSVQEIKSSIYTQVVDFGNRCRSSVSRLALPVINAGGSYVVSRLAATSESEQPLLLGSLLLASAAGSLLTSREPSYQSELLTKASAAKISQLRLSPAETEELLALFSRWPSDETTPPALLLGVDLFHCVDRAAEDNEELKKCLENFCQEYHLHDMTLAIPWGKKHNGVLYTFFGCNDDHYAKKRFSKALTQLESDYCRIKKGGALTAKIALWKKLLANNCYTDLILREGSFLFEEDPSPTAHLEMFDDMARFLGSAFHGLVPTKKGAPEHVEWLEALQKGHKRGNPRLFLQALKKSLERFSQEDLNLLYLANKDLFKSASRWRFYIQRVMNLYEERLYGYSRKDHLARIQQNLVYTLRSVTPTLPSFQTFYKKFSQKHPHFFAKGDEVLRLIETTPTSASILIRINFRNQEFRVSPHHLIEELRKIHKDATHQARNREDSRYCDFLREYRDNALDFARFYLLIADICKLENDEFSSDPISSLPDELLELLTLKEDTMCDIDEEEADLSRNSSLAIQEDSSEEEAQEPLPKEKIKRRPASSLQQPVSQESGTISSVSVSSSSTAPNIRIRNVKHRKLVKIMRKNGFFCSARRGGSHQTMVQQGTGRKVTVAGHSGGAVYKRKTVQSIFNSLN